MIGRKVSLSSVHINLYRLEDREYVASEMRGGTSTRGGRRERYFEITNAGLSLLYKIKGYSYGCIFLLLISVYETKAFTATSMSDETIDRNMPG